MNRMLLLAVATCVSVAASHAADTVRICTYNVLKFSAANEDGRVPQFARILDSIRPHLLVCQEVEDAAMGPRFVSSVCTWTSFAATPYIDGEDTDNMLLYDQTMFDFIGQRRISTTLRDIAEFTVATRPTNGTQPDTIVLYSVHLKASDDSQSAAQRAAEVDRMLAEMSSRSGVIICGDMNIYGPNEAAYTKLVGSSATRRFIDPLGTSWARNDTRYAGIYTQCTRKTTIGTCGGGVDGGLDDRFDLILVSQQLANRIVPGSLTPFGNDGVPRLNESIDEPVNQRVSAEMAAALKCASDHLPLYMDIILGDVQASIQGAVTDTSWYHIESSALVIDDAVPGAVLRLYDIAGRLRLERLVTATPMRIELTGLPAGTYGLNVGTRWTAVGVANSE